MKRKLEQNLFFLLILLLPTQLGKHFWPDFSSVLGIRIDYLSPTVYLTDILVVMLLIVWLLRKNPKSKILNPKQYQNLNTKIKKRFEYLKFKNWNLFRIWNLGFGILLLYIIINVLFSNRLLGGMYSLLKLSEMSFVAYYTAKFTDMKKIFPGAIMVLSIGAIVESILTIAQFFKQGSIGGLLYYLGERNFSASTPGIANASLNGELVLRPYGTFPHPNVLAGYLVVVMILILLANSFRKVKKEVRSTKYELRFINWLPHSLILNSLFVIQVTALAFGSTALFLTMSRVAILLWVIILGWFIIKRTIHFPDVLADASLFGKVDHDARWILKWGKNRIKAGVVLIAVSVITSIFILSPISFRFTDIRINDEAVLQRTILNEKAISMVRVNPLFGVGLGNFLPTLAKVQKPLTTSTYLQPVHNIFLLVAAETGLIGLGLFLWFLWKTFQIIKKKELRIKEQLLIALLTILILGLFDHYWLTLQQSQLLFALIIGLCWANLDSSAQKPRVKAQIF